MTRRLRRTVIAAHDGRSRGLDAVARGREIAEAADARLLVVHVTDSQMPYWSTDPVHQHILRDQLARVFEPAREIGGPRVETRTIGSSGVVAALAQAAEEEQAGVVVIGSSHHGPVGRAFYGDLARQLGRRCERRVEVAPVGAHERTVAASAA